VQHFLLIYDQGRQELRSSRQFGTDESEAATDAYREAEKQYSGDTQIEIVLVGADSLKTIERTHGHYFRSNDRLAKYLVSA